MQLNVKEFARFMGYSVQAITKNIANGMPVIRKGTQGVPAIIDADIARAWIEERKTQRSNQAAINKAKLEEKAAKKEQRRIKNEGKKIKNFCPILLECANCKKERHQGFFFKQKGGPRSGTRTIGRNCIICESLKDSGADKIPERFSSLEYKKEKEFNEWQHKQWGIPVPAFCHVYLPCKRCKKERHQGFFYRHNDNKHDGVRDSALCNLCREFGRVDKPFEEYEQQQNNLFKAWQLEQSGKFCCSCCSNIGAIENRQNGTTKCRACYLIGKSHRRVKPEDRKKEYVPKSEAKSLIYALLKKSTSVGQWQHWAWVHWNKVAPDEWFVSFYEKKGKPWNNPRLSSGERYKMRYAMDLDYKIKERVRRQVRKKIKRDGIGTVLRDAVKRDGESKTVMDKLGFSIANFKAHFESLFTDGMSWDEFAKGNIHIDHIKPQRLFDLTNDDDWRACWSLSNLQPLWARDNIAKGGKYEEA